MLPFDLPLVSRGFAELTPPAASLGSLAAKRVATALSRLLDEEVQLSGRTLPGQPVNGTACARLLFDLPALPGTAVVEIDPGFIARLVDRLAGGTGEPRSATALTPVETSLLELMALVSLDALSKLEPIERAFSPRLAREGPWPVSPLCVALELRLGEEYGRARLLIPPAAVRTLRGPAALAESVAQAQLKGSVRQGGATLSLAEFSELGVGDILLLDPDPAEHLVLPGGYHLRGRITDERFQVEALS